MGLREACKGCCLGSKVPDMLDPADRGFFENTVAKYVISIVCAAAAMLFLGLTATSGAIAASQMTLKDKPHEGDDSIYQTEIGGYGFGAICYFIAFCLSLASAIIISPTMTGSQGEMDNMRSPGTFIFKSTR